MINYIMTHMGLGDSLICNGLIRNLVNNNKEYILFSNNTYRESLLFMYRDLKNLKHQFIDNQELNESLITKHIIGVQNYNLISIGFSYLYHSNLGLDKAFYKQHNIPFEKRWDNFFVDRDINKEKDFLKKFNVNEGEYIFLHDGGSSGNAKINKNNINKKLKIIEANPSLTNNIFDYCYLIENAKEIHCIESSFAFLIDSIRTSGELFIYRNAKKLNYNEIPTYKKEWNIIN